jgi:uncharacterized membrane protein YdbT with pleckstrin-like domain
MPFPRRLLNDNENMVLDLHPHWWFFGPSALSLGVAMVAVLWVRSLVSGWMATVVGYFGLGIIVVCAARLAVDVVKWRTTYFVVTTERIIFRQGVVARDGVEIPLDRLANVNFKQSALERLLGVGDILLQSGGQDGEQTFSDISRPDEVQKTIISTLSDRSNRRFEGAPSLAGVAHELERLEALRDRGTLTEAEFEEQKRRLLG